MTKTNDIYSKLKCSKEEVLDIKKIDSNILEMVKQYNNAFKYTSKISKDLITE